MLASVMASGWPGGMSAASPVSTPTRQVEQRARPPHTEACGTLLMRLISSSVGPRWHPHDRAAACRSPRPCSGRTAQLRRSARSSAQGERAARNAGASRSCSVSSRGRDCRHRARASQCCSSFPGAVRASSIAARPCAPGHREAAERGHAAGPRRAQQHRLQARDTGRYSRSQIVHADAAVHPHDQQQRALQGGAAGHSCASSKA